MQTAFNITFGFYFDFYHHYDMSTFEEEFASRLAETRAIVWHLGLLFTLISH